VLTTYRFQVHPEFGLDRVTDLLHHVVALGASHIYLSPIFEARAGSTHGYDVTDPTRVREEIGGDAAFERLVRDTHRCGLGILLDIVPNHMAASEENPWLRDVLEIGDGSRYRKHFDLSWRADPAEPRLALPILGRPLEEAIDEGEITVEADELGFALRYYARRLPLDPRSLALLLGDDLAAALGVLESARDESADAAAAEQARERVADGLRGNPPLRTRVTESLDRVNALPGPARRHTLLALIARQAYVPVFWREIDSRLAYRRFFDITDLIGVRVEDEAVFEDTHRRLLDWVRTGAVNALRIDHVDGLLDPTGYLSRLRAACAKNAPQAATPIVVEKILAHDEPLPAGWPIDGTTGYEFMNALNGLFIEPSGLERITEWYRELTGIEGSFDDIVYEKKRLVLQDLFAGEWRVIARELLALMEPGTGSDTDPRHHPLARALFEVTACLRVYRTYTRTTDSVEAADRARIDAAVAEARGRSPGTPPDALERIRALLLLEPAPDTDAHAEARLRWLMRWQQVTGPAMAKGLEDTALYTFYPLASANDVGGEADAERAVRSPESLHRFLMERAGTPLTMNATSTHDTKRSEDVRARLNVLSEIPGDWIERVERWRRLNRRFGGSGVPTPNEEYLLYQSIVGAWPADEVGRGDFVARMQRYMEKALREAKASTNWLVPDEAHESAVATFIERILDEASNAEFVRDVDTFVARIAPFGVLNSLAQVIIKAWAPGVPDFYQGTESWAFDLVDPDNRRPVDFDARAGAVRTADQLLRELAAGGGDPGGAARMLARWADGRIKVLVTAAALRERAAAPAVFTGGGAFHPLEATGPKAAHLFGFARATAGDWRAAVVPRHAVGLGSAAPVGRDVWGDSAVRLPKGAPRAWRNVLTGESITAVNGSLDIGTLFATLPFALLRPAG
jgi:(1->4)-alpha-D-glucan 1-alpha-D-glucosylmutase